MIVGPEEPTESEITTTNDIRLDGDMVRTSPMIRESGAVPDQGMQQHDDTQQRRLRLRLSVEAREAIKAIAGAQGVTPGGLLDALLHGLETADERWLNGVIEQARQTDARRPSSAHPNVDNA